MKCVGVKYKGSNKIYYFSVPKVLEQYVGKRNKVECGNIENNTHGVVVDVREDMTDGEIKELTGGRELQKIRGVMYKANLSELALPSRVQGSKPAVGKLTSRIEEYYKTGSFKANVEFEVDGYGRISLVDGYTAFLVARMFNRPFLYGILKAQ